MKKIIKYVMADILRTKIIIAYTCFLFLLSLSILILDNNTTKALLSLLNLVLIIVPMVSVVFATIYLYNSVEFIELLVSQPLKRTTIWLSMFWGIAIAIMLAFLVGVGIPVLIYQATEIGFMLLAIGALLSVIFSAFSMLAFAFIRDKAKGIGISVLVWLVTALLFDGVVLFLLFQFADYPLEKYMLAVSFCNPIDLGRIFILLKMDVSALMGYTGAIFRMFFGTNWGISIAFIALLSWIVVPLWLSVRKFVNKDL